MLQRLTPEWAAQHPWHAHLTQAVLRFSEHRYRPPREGDCAAWVAANLEAGNLPLAVKWQGTHAGNLLLILNYPNSRAELTILLFEPFHHRGIGRLAISLASAALFDCNWRLVTLGTSHQHTRMRHLAEATGFRQNATIVGWFFRAEDASQEDLCIYIRRNQRWTFGEPERLPEFPTVT